MAVCYMAHLQDMVGRLMINAARCGAPLSLSMGALASAAQDLTARCTVGLPGGAAPSGGGRGGGRGVGFVVLPPLLLCRAEYTRVTTSQMSGVTNQALRGLEAWLGNRRHLMGWA
jgi:hypothetical protein